MSWFVIIFLIALVGYRYLLETELEGENEGGAVGWDTASKHKPRLPPEFSNSRLSQGDTDIIAKLANGEKELTEEAIAIYRFYINKGVQSRSCAAMRFMAEVDNLNPDLSLRRFYREEVLMENPHIFN